MTQKSCDMKNLSELGFALDDALLYLDTHPCEESALCYYQQMQAAYNAAREAYTACYGPLRMDEVPQGCTHRWLEEPWPWEGEV